MSCHGKTSFSFFAAPPPPPPQNYLNHKAKKGRAFGYSPPQDKDVVEIREFLVVGFSPPPVVFFFFFFLLRGGGGGRAPAKKEKDVLP